LSSLEQVQNPLEQSNEKCIDMKLWNEAKNLSDLGKLVNPSGENQVASVYRDLLWFENQTDKRVNGRESTLLHKQADKNT
jgi:hypothetical protein